MQTLSELIAGERELLSVHYEKIRLDGGTQYRDLINPSTVSDYISAIKVDEVFPPLDTVFDGSEHWLVDGFHRYHALRQIGINLIPVRAITGTVEEAKLLALTANTKHGLPRDQATKKKIVLAALAHSALTGSSDYQIAKVCGVSHPFVASMRDPAARERQQQARDKSATSRIKQEVANPIHTPEGVNSAEGEFPDEDEIRASELALEANIQMMNKLLESDEPLKLAHEENKRLNLLHAQLEIRFRGLMGERNEAVKMIKPLQRQNEWLRKKLRTLSPPRTDIRNDLQIKHFETLYGENSSSQKESQ